MGLQELKEQVYKLSVDDRLALINLIVESLQDHPPLKGDRSSAIKRMRGLLKTDSPPPTDQEVEAMLDQRRVEKYLQ